ncbi:DUF1338 family protein [Kineosporia sp. NBRC 101731]|uniref:2-oxoadipate dioxygenase/decarboxylase n=1 Tax=Kineosporia sp. NBRC 101731 TaxID=3032199 RepID=UPI0024A37AAB|nr:DUF1338 family protein [Kineosporia sp. NBRC 101731]GLY32983.1 hypothetical protein Kisp02_63480 [Kineosporia sp. NBRC 101731]
MRTMTSAQVRAAFAIRLARIYGEEVPLYTTLVEVSQQVNRDVIAARGSSALQLGGVERVTAERHGAIRVGTPDELHQVGRIFAAMGMHPVGFYDLREAAPDPVPVVSTAFRPIDPDELEFNPFRVFTSVLVPDDPRFFGSGLQEELTAFLARRQLFPPELMPLADTLAAEGELPTEQAEQFLKLAASAFELSPEPVDHAWYRRLERVSSVAADIGGVTTTHVNHLTPRVLDIDELYRRMTALGVTMIPSIQGPPRWGGPDVLLRQTSFRALDEARPMRFEDGSVRAGTLRVRFGEVEQRAIALTPAGRDLIESFDTQIHQKMRDEHHGERAQVTESVWRAGMPASEEGLLAQDLGYFRFAPGHPVDASVHGSPLSALELVRSGALIATPIVYEDFLPRSAAGIFSSNLTGAGAMDAEQAGTVRDAAWISQALGKPVHSGEALYERQSRESLVKAVKTLGLNPSSIRELALPPLPAHLALP